MRLRKAMFSVLLGGARLFRGSGIGKITLVERTFRFLFLCLQPAGVELVEVGGNRVYVKAGDVDLRFAHGASRYRDSQEGVLINLFKREVKPGMVVVDLGGNAGFYTLLAAGLVGDGGKVFVFEPAPDCFDFLSRNIALYGYENIVATRKAVADRSGQVRLFLNDYNTGRHNIFDHYDQRQKFITVDCVTLDEFFEGKDQKVDFIKMDIEGAEMAALRGMHNLFTMNRRIRLVTEFNPGFLRKAGSSPEEFLEKLAEYGFELFYLNSEKNPIEPFDLSSALKAHNAGRTMNLFCVRGE